MEKRRLGACLLVPGSLLYKLWLSEVNGEERRDSEGWIGLSSPMGRSSSWQYGLCQLFWDGISPPLCRTEHSSWRCFFALVDVLMGWFWLEGTLDFIRFQAQSSNVPPLGHVCWSVDVISQGLGWLKNASFCSERAGCSHTAFTVYILTILDVVKQMLETSCGCLVHPDGNLDGNVCMDISPSHITGTNSQNRNDNNHKSFLHSDLTWRHRIQYILMKSTKPVCT